MDQNIEVFWDIICSELEILEDPEKRELIKEYGNRMYLTGFEAGENSILNKIKD